MINLYFWTTPTLGGPKGPKVGNAYYVGGHVMMPLRKGDGIEPVVVTARNNVIRMRDGKSVGAIPYNHGTTSNSPVVYNGDIVYRGTDGNNPLGAYRLTWQGDDLKIETVLETGKVTLKWAGAVAMPGYYLVPNGKRAGIVSVPGGKVMGEL